MTEVEFPLYRRAAEMGPGQRQRPHRRAYRYREVLHRQWSDRAGSPPGQAGHARLSHPVSCPCGRGL